MESIWCESPENDVLFSRTVLIVLVNVVSEAILKVVKVSGFVLPNAPLRRKGENRLPPSPGVAGPHVELRKDALPTYEVFHSSPSGWAALPSLMTFIVFHERI